MDLNNINKKCQNNSESAADTKPAANDAAIQPDIAGYFPLHGGARPKTAPMDGISDTPPDGECADVFSDGTAVVQFEKGPAAEKILRILDDSNAHYRAVGSESKVRLFFSSNGLKGCHRTALLCGIAAEITGSHGYLEHLEGSLAVLHADEKYDTVPLWLCPVKDCSPLNSTTLTTGETEWIGYLKQVYRWLKDSKKHTAHDAYAAAIDTAKILNKHFRKHPFHEQRMAGSLDIMELELDMEKFYTEETDRSGRSRTVFLKDKFAEWLIERYHLVNLDHTVHRYSNGVYVPAAEKECEALLHKYLKNSCASARKEMVQTVFSLLGVYARGTASEADMYYDLKSRCKPELIAFNNGIFDILTGEWHDFSPDIIITNRIPVDYVDFGQNAAGGAETEAVEIIDSWLDSFSEYNTDKRAVLEEAAGLALYCRNEGLRRQHTILAGSKASGKSTYIKMVESLVGRENCSHIALEDICSPNDRFCTYPLVGALLNTYADISSYPVKGAARLKNICTNDPIKVEQKNQPATTLIWNGKMIFGCNQLPAITDPAVIDRFEIIPCNADYGSTGQPCMPNLYTDCLTKTDCMQYWCYLAVQGLKRFIANGYKHTYCEEIEAFRREYSYTANPVEAFIGYVPEGDIEGHETGEVFSRYLDFSADVLKLPDYKVKHITKNSFTSDLKKLGYDTKRKSVHNDKIQVYIKCS